MQEGKSRPPRGAGYSHNPSAAPNPPLPPQRGMPAMLPRLPCAARGGTEAAKPPQKCRFLCRSGEEHPSPAENTVGGEGWYFFFLFCCVGAAHLPGSSARVRGCECGQAPSAPRGRLGCRVAGRGLGRFIFREGNKSGLRGVCPAWKQRREQPRAVRGGSEGWDPPAAGAGRWFDAELS